MRLRYCSSGQLYDSGRTMVTALLSECTALKRDFDEVVCAFPSVGKKRCDCERMRCLLPLMRKLDNVYDAFGRALSKLFAEQSILARCLDRYTPRPSIWGLELVPLGIVDASLT
jgi:hypothetical protein